MPFKLMPITTTCSKLFLLSEWNSKNKLTDHYMIWVNSS